MFNFILSEYSASLVFNETLWWDSFDFPSVFYIFVLYFCLALWATGFNQGHLCGRDVGEATYESWVTQQKICHWRQSLKQPKITMISQESHGPLPQCITECLLAQSPTGLMEATWVVLISWVPWICHAHKTVSWPSSLLSSFASSMIFCKPLRRWYRHPLETEHSAVTCTWLENQPHVSILTTTHC